MTSQQSALSPHSILDYISKSLPSRSSNDQPLRIKDPYAAIALFCHACMIAVGFRLMGLGEDHRLEAQSEPDQVRPLPSEWDASSTYAFRYAHLQSSMEFLVKISRLGNKALVFGIGLGDDKTASFEVKAQDYISEGSLKATTDLQPSNIQDIFISSGRMADLSSLFRANIIQKLVPGIQKEGYEDTTPTAAQSRQEETRQPYQPPPNPLRDDREPPARPYPFVDPLAAAPPRRPVPVGDFAPPGFEDEYELQRPPRGLLGEYGGRNPLAIGDRDLYPPGLGPNDPLRMGPGGGFPGGGGGMHPTFDDPLFGGQGGRQPYDPRAPPGARYDPIGPGDGPPNVRGGPRFPGGRGGGFGGNPFSGFGGNDFI